MTNFAPQKNLTRPFVSLLVLAGLGGLNTWLFPLLFQVTYWDWYLQNGKFIGFITAIMAMVIGDFLDKNTGLISANPGKYLAACLHTVGLPIFAYGTLNRVNFNAPGRRKPGLESLAGLLFSLVALVLMLAWLVVVTPVQYLAHLVFGAPIRYMLKADFRTIYKRAENGDLVVDYVPQSAQLSEGWRVLDAFSKPVSNTATISAIFWFILEAALKS